MLNISVTTNLKEFERHVNEVARRQIPFAAARAVNALAEKIGAAEQENEEKVLDRPKGFTTNALRVSKGNKREPVAVVYMLDRTAEYLEPYQFGGQNKLNGRALLKPVGAMEKLDRFGNLPRNYLKSLKGRSDIFIGPVKTARGTVNGVWQRAQGEWGARPVTQVSVTKTGKVVVRNRKAYAPSREGRRLKLLVEFTEAHTARQYLDWFGVAQRLVDAEFNRVFSAELADAIANAK